MSKDYRSLPPADRAPDPADKRRKGFFMCDDRLVATRGLSVYTKMTYVILARHADKDRSCYPSERLICEEAGFSERTVRKSIHELEALRMIKVDRRNGAHHTYTLQAEALWKVPVGSATTGKTPAPRAAVGGKTPARPAAVQDITPAPRAAGPRHHVPPKETYIKETHIQACASDAEFQKLKEAWPRGYWKAEEKALAAWTALSPTVELFALMIKALEAQKDSSQWKRGIGIPHPARWLEEKRWTDETPTHSSPGQVAQPEEKPVKKFVRIRDGWRKVVAGVLVELGPDDVPPDRRQAPPALFAALTEKLSVRSGATA